MPDLTTLTAPFADAEHQTFSLGLDQLRELEERSGRGPMATFQRLAAGAWSVDEVRETIRLGLIGGGKEPAEALKLVQRYVDGQPLERSIMLAMAVLAARLSGADKGRSILMAGGLIPAEE